MAGSASRENGKKGGRPRKDGARPGGQQPPKPLKVPRQQSTPRGSAKDSPALAAGRAAYAQFELARAGGDTAKMQAALVAIGQALKDAPKPAATPLVTFPHISHHKKRAFLMAYAEYPTVTHAAAAAGIDRRTHQNWRKTDPVYEEAFTGGAQPAAGDRLVKEAMTRARQEETGNDSRTAKTKLCQ